MAPPGGHGPGRPEIVRTVRLMDRLTFSMVVVKFQRSSIDFPLAFSAMIDCRYKNYERSFVQDAPVTLHWRASLADLPVPGNCKLAEQIGVGISIGIEGNDMAFGHEKLDVYRAAINWWDGRTSIAKG